MTSDSPMDDPQVPVTDELVIDLLEDPREVGGVLGFGYPEVPVMRGAPTVGSVFALAAARLDGYSEYGS